MNLRRPKTLKALWALVAMTATLAFIVGGQTTASAHGGKVFQGKDFALVYDDYRTVAVCDEEKDGHGVSAVLHAGASKSFELYNANGADGDCEVATMSWRIESISVCEENKGCNSDSF